MIKAFEDWQNDRPKIHKKAVDSEGAQSTFSSSAALALPHPAPNEGKSMTSEVRSHHMHQTSLNHFVNLSPSKPHAPVGSASPKISNATATPSGPVAAAKPIARPVGYVPSGSGPDSMFSEFCNLCDRIAAEPSHTGKTRLVRAFLTQGASGTGFTGDIYLVLHLLLPLHPKRVYNMKDKQLVKALSQLIHAE